MAKLGEKGRFLTTKKHPEILEAEGARKFYFFRDKTPKKSTIFNPKFSTQLELGKGV